MSTPNSIPTPKRPVYIEGIGWRYPIEHRMTRWPRWKDSHKPGTYMITLSVNSNQKVLGTLAGTSRAVYQWMKEHPEAVSAASSDALYYRHALLGTRAMPFVKEEHIENISDMQHHTSGVETLTNKDSCTIINSETTISESSTIKSPCGSVPTPATSNNKPRTHFPLKALSQPDAPHIVLSPLGEKVKLCLENMPHAIPQIDLICYAIMPNHIHFIVAVRSEMQRSIKMVVRSFMSMTSNIMHRMIKEGTVKWSNKNTVSQKERGDKDAPLWKPGSCIGICYTERKLHTRIGYVLENPFFGILESERHGFMERTMGLNIAGRKYCAYGNMLLLKEPDRMQVFCHRKHPITNEPYHLTQDFLREKQSIIEASANGVVIVTPGISPGEQDIMLEVLRSGGNVINILKEDIPLSDKWHPDKERRLYCSQGNMLVLSVADLPHQTFHDRWGNIIPTNTKYAKFHLLNFVAEEICQEGIEHQVRMAI